MARGEVRKICVECGNEFRTTKQFFKRADAERWEQWAEQNIDTCPECYKKAEMANHLRHALEYAKDNNLPTLSGTEKQISWAETIRYDVLKEIKPEDMFYLRKSVTGFEASDGDMEALIAAGGTLEEVTEMYRDIHKRELLMLTSTSAKEIIENK